MTKQEYEKLVKGSMSFKSMQAAMQAAILTADGEQMEKYIRMFQEEAEMLQRAFQNFQSETEQVVVDYKVNVQKGQRKRLVAAESKTRNQEIGNAENLLKNL